jgi:hypothetical protein
MCKDRVCKDRVGNKFNNGDRVVVVDYNDVIIAKAKKVPSFAHKLVGKAGIIIHTPWTTLWFPKVRLDDPDIATPDALFPDNDTWCDIGWTICNAILRPEEKDEEITKPYRITADGFLTSDENWKKWLI